MRIKANGPGVYRGKEARCVLRLRSHMYIKANGSGVY